MNKAGVLSLLPLINSKQGNVHRTGWVVGRCPFAPVTHAGGTDKNPSFGISIGASSRYHCFSCNQSGDLADLPLVLKHKLGKGKHEGYDLAKALQLISTGESELPLDIPDYESTTKDTDDLFPFSEQWLSSFGPALGFNTAREYLKKRGVPDWVAMELDLRYDSTYKRVCFPIRDFNGALVGFHGRDITGTAPYPYHAYKSGEHWNKLPWLGESWLDADKPVVLVESVFDLARVYEVYQNVACSLSAGIGKEKALRMKKYPEIITLYDWGTGGDTARKTLAKYLGGRINKQLGPTSLEGDPGNMSIQRIADVLKPFISLEGMKFVD